MSANPTSRWARMFPPVQQLTNERLRSMIDQARMKSRLEWSAREKDAWQELRRRERSGEAE